MKIFKILKKCSKCLVAALTVAISVTTITPGLSKPGTPSEYSVCGGDEDIDPNPTETIPRE